ncbi:hypothetical protein GCM10022237_08810 [Nocardioides ginsengisoli]|uniref:DUF4232 domain-containing protein n=1 Tax=Nocardioides ginsengisoli TaxID=363868 RepID=A0ABW3W0C6_9ACTN
MSDHDDLHQRLSDAGRRWREGLPPATEAVRHVAPPQRGPRRWTVPVAAAAAAAAVAAIAGASVVLRSGDDQSPKPPVATQPTPTPTPTPPPTPPTGPPPSPTGPVACGPDDLVAGAPQTEGAAGTAVIIVPLTLAAGAEPCTIEGYPDVALLQHGTDLGLTGTHNTAFPPSRIRMAPGATADVSIGWAVSHYCGNVDNDQIRITLPGGQILTVPGFGQSSCSPGEQGSPPWVTSVTRQ